MPENGDPNARGTAFEDLVAILLELFRATHPEVVRVERHPRIYLQNGTVAIPDFELICALPHQTDHHIIECQDRRRSSQEIVHKIRDIKSMSSKNRFVFIFKEPDYLSDSVRTALDADGIMYYFLSEFSVFIDRLSRSIEAIEASRVEPKPAAPKTIDLTREIAGVLEKRLGARAANQFAQGLQDFPPKKDGAMLTSLRRRW